MWYDVQGNLLLLPVQFRGLPPKDREVLMAQFIWITKMSFGRKISFQMVHSTVYVRKTIFLRKWTVTDKYRQSVSIFELITETTRLNAHPSFTAPQAYSVRGNAVQQREGEPASLPSQLCGCQVLSLSVSQSPLLESGDEDGQGPL